MANLDRPLLRPLSGRRVEHRGQDCLALTDPLGSFRDPILVASATFQRIIRHFDGRSTVDQILDLVERTTGSRPDFGEIAGLIADLDRRMVLDGPTFAEYRAAYAAIPIRSAALAGRSYPADATRLRADLAGHAAAAGGAGAGSVEAPGGLRGVLSPHIDFGRGGPTYSWAYRELARRSDAEVFVILGVAHQPCRHRFALTRKHFATPLGVARTDQGFVDRLAEGEGAAWFDDELAHRTEHSIEFQVVQLQEALGEGREFAIVPILVGSFHDLMRGGVEPILDAEVRRMVDALRAAEAASGRKIAYIGGIDLCHVGPEFGDSGPVDDAFLARVRDFDRTLLDRAVGLDAAGWFEQAARVENRYRVCGLAATYTMLHAIGPSTGRLLRYDQAVDPARTCCVSFASVAFDALAS